MVEDDDLRPMVVQRSIIPASLREARRSGVGQGLTAGMVVVALVVTFLLVIVGLVFQKYWQPLSWLVAVAVGAWLAYFIIKAAAWSVHEIADARRSWVREDLQVVKGHIKKPVVAVKEGTQPLQWVPPQPWGHIRSLHYDVAQEAVPALAAPDEDAPQFPTAILYRNIAPLIPASQLLVGVRPGGTLRTETLKERRSVLILGKSGSGKTMTLATRVAEAVKVGAALIVCDPHAHKEDSLARKIAPLLPYLWPDTMLAQEVADILENIRYASAELTARIAGGRYSAPLVVVIEEFNALYYDARVKSDLQALTRDMTMQGRGFEVYLYAGAQRMQGNLFAELRDLFAGYTIHRVEYADANTLLHDSRLAKQAMQQKPGQTIVIDANGDQDMLMQPLITRADLLEIVATTLPALPPLPPNPNRVSVSVQPPAPQPAPAPAPAPTHTLTHKAVKVTLQQRQFILKQTAAGKSPSAIAMLLWNDAHKNIIVRQVLEEEAQLRQMEEDDVPNGHTVS